VAVDDKDKDKDKESPVLLLLEEDLAAVVKEAEPAARRIDDHVVDAGTRQRRDANDETNIFGCLWLAQLMFV
jgi:hypothetical protein